MFTWSTDIVGPGMTPTARDGSGSGGDGVWIQVSTQSDCAVITVGGVVDLTASPKLAMALQTAIHNARMPRVVLDMTHLSFIDSTGLAVLIHARNQARLRGASLALVNPPRLVEHLLVGTRLHDHFTVYETLHDALKQGSDL